MPRKTRANVTQDELIALLHAEDYSAACLLGKKSIVHLRTIVEQRDSNLAAKATYLAGLLNADESVGIIDAAAKSRKPALRAAAAAAAAHLSPNRAEPILLRLLKSKDIGIRKTAIKSAGSSTTEKVRRQLELLQTEEPDAHLKRLAADSLNPN